MTNKGFKTLFALLAKRLEVYSEKDPKVLKQLIEKLDEQLKSRPKLKRLVDLEYRMTYSMLTLADQLEAILNQYRRGIPSEYRELFEACSKIRILKSNLVNIVKQAITSDIFESLKLADNSYIAKALAYQEALKYVGLNDKELDQIFAKYKSIAKGLDKEIEELRKILINMKKDIDTKLQKLNVKQEAFETIKQIIRKALERILFFAYKFYKKVSLIVNKVDNWIRNRIASVQNRIIQTIAGDNPGLQLAVQAMFSAMGIALHSKKVRSKIMSFEPVSQAYKALSSLPIMGPLKIGLGFISVIYMLNKFELTVVSGLQQASALVNNALNALDELDKVLDEVEG